MCVERNEALPLSVSAHREQLVIWYQSRQTDPGSRGLGTRTVLTDKHPSGRAYILTECGVGSKGPTVV